MKYEDFVFEKLSRVPPTGLSVIPELNASLFPFQRDLVTWALRRGRCAIFADTGLGKTRQELEWARCVALATGGRVLILAPLAVGAQTVREAERVGIDAKQVRYAADIEDAPSIVVTNYDRIHHFDASAFAGVVCDESSVIKNSDSKTFATLTEMFAGTAFRLCATATPSPNDYTELGTHAEFLGICTKEEMLAEYFCHDGGETQTWRLKGHARGAFWKWVAGWAALIRKPSDFGYSDDGYDLPPLIMTQHTIAADPEQAKSQGLLFAEPARTLTERRSARKASLTSRVRDVVEMVTMGCEQCASQSLQKSEKSTPTISDGRSVGTPSTESDSRPTESAQDHPKRAGRRRESTANDPSRDETKSFVHGTPPSLNSASAFTESESEPSTDSGPVNTSCSLPPRAADVQSASNRKSIDSASITLTKTEASGAYSAGSATSASAASATTPSGSKWPRGTCGCSRNEQWLIWVELNAEEEAIMDALGREALAVRGSDDALTKEMSALAWMRGDVRILVSKPSIFGFGLNFQFAARMAFVGVKDSYESTYQAIRRCWRFGQTRPVHVHVFSSELEGEVVKNLERKERDALAMSEALSAETREVVRAEIMGQKRQTNAHTATTLMAVPGWLT